VLCGWPARARLVDRACVPVSPFLVRPATAAIYTLSLHDALPISERAQAVMLRDQHVLQDREVVEEPQVLERARDADVHDAVRLQDRKSTRLNSSHVKISYAVFCLKKKIPKD